MKKTIKGNSSTCYRGVEEHLDDYLPMFKKYFRNIAHHHNIHHGIAKDVILLYSYFPVEIDCRGCHNERKELKISCQDSHTIPVEFFSTNHRDLECTHVDRIFYNDILVGFYCPKNNVFCCGDFAHYNGQENHVLAILDGMEEAGYLHPLYNNGQKNTITLGADPEMETLVNGSLVSATNLPQLCTRDKTYISHDGHTQPQRELRPDPADNPAELVENIRDLIRISSFFNEDLSVMGNELPLGGHIHIGNASPSAELVSVLDYFLFPFNEFSSCTRKGSKYGKPGDVRIQPHGFEYRTPPAAWLLTPTLARMTLELVQLIVEKIINDVDVEISDNFNMDEYKTNLGTVGFHELWITQFLHEIEWAKSHINEPLAKIWDVEIPKEYRIKKVYRNKYQAPPRPRPISSLHPIFVEPMMVAEKEHSNEEGGVLGQ